MFRAVLDNFQIQFIGTTVLTSDLQHSGWPKTGELGSGSPCVQNWWPPRCFLLSQRQSYPCPGSIPIGQWNPPGQLTQTHSLQHILNQESSLHGESISPSLLKEYWKQMEKISIRLNILHSADQKVYRNIYRTSCLRCHSPVPSFSPLPFG